MLYFLVGLRLNISSTNLVLITVLAIFSHAAYDLVRDYLEGFSIANSASMRQELSALGRGATTDEALAALLEPGAGYPV